MSNQPFQIVTASITIVLQNSPKQDDGEPIGYLAHCSVKTNNIFIMYFLTSLVSLAPVRWIQTHPLIPPSLTLPGVESDLSTVKNQTLDKTSIPVTLTPESLSVSLSLPPPAPPGDPAQQGRFHIVINSVSK